MARCRSPSVVCSGISGRSSTRRIGLALAEPGEETIERRIAGTTPEDPLEAGAQTSRPAPVGLVLPSLQVAVEPPDQLPHEIDGTALRRGDRQELVDQPLGMDPAQGVRTDAELSGIIRHDHCVAEQAMLADGAPHRPLGGDLHRIGRYLERRDAESLEMRRPGVPVGKLRWGCEDSLSITGPARLCRRM